MTHTVRDSIVVEPRRRFGAGVWHETAFVLALVSCGTLIWYLSTPPHESGMRGVLRLIAPASGVLGIALLLQACGPSRSKTLRTAVLIFGWAIAARYFGWRLFTLPSAPLPFGWLAWALLGLEVVNATVVHFNYWMSGVALTDRSTEADRHAGFYGDTPPLVDVFIATYNESFEVLRRTVVAAQHLDYPRFRVWLLDDGCRPWLEQFAGEHGINYLCRTSNEHYKAGNLNHALNHVRGLAEPPDFIAVLDADFVLLPRFLTRTVALMHDPKVALVQTPQEFFNADPFQYAFRNREAIPDDTRSLYRVRLRGMDGRGMSSCCGTSFLVRLSALTALGGFPTASVTEDLLTSLHLAKLGRRCVFLAEPLSSGLAAEGLHEHLVQRARWALGLIQAGRSSAGPISGKRWPASWFFYTAFTLKWLLSSLLRHAFLWAPILMWFTGIPLVHANAEQAAYYVLPLFACRALQVWLESGANLPIISDAMALLTGWVVIPASIKAYLSKGGKPFVVTGKGIQRRSLVVHWQPLRYFVAIFALTVAGATYGLTFGGAGLDRSGAVFMVGWSVYNLLLVAVAATPCFEQPKFRLSERFAAHEGVLVRRAGVESRSRLIDLSTTGCSLKLEANVGDDVRVALDNVGWVDATVVRIHSTGVGLRFQCSSEQADALTLGIYCSETYIRHPKSWSWGAGMKAVLARAIA